MLVTVPMKNEKRYKNRNQQRVVRIVCDIYDLKIAAMDQKHNWCFCVIARIRKTQIFSFAFTFSTVKVI